MQTVKFPRSPNRVAELVFFFFYDNGLLSGQRFFIEAGAADGKDQSNTWALEQVGWRGLLVEPHDLAYQVCVKNRPEAIVAYTALVSPSYEKETIVLAHSSHHFLCNHIADEDNPLDDEDGLEETPATTLATLLDRAQEHYKNQGFAVKPRLDFFSLDVEGYEFEVLEGTELNRYHPAFLLIESAKLEALTEYLDFYNYEYLTSLSGHDHFFGSRRIWGPNKKWRFRSAEELPIPEEGGSTLLSSSIAK